MIAQEQEEVALRDIQTGEVLKWIQAHVLEELLVRLMTDRNFVQAGSTFAQKQVSKACNFGLTTAQAPLESPALQELYQEEDGNLM